MSDTGKVVIDHIDGKGSVEADPATGLVMVRFAIGNLSMSFGMHAGDAHNLGEALVGVAAELIRPGAGKG